MKPQFIIGVVIGLACIQNITASVDADLPGDTDSQNTVWNGRDFSDVKYPLLQGKNEAEPLHVHTRDKRQTAPRGRPALMQDFLYFANRRFLIHANRNGSGVQTFTLTNTSGATAVDFDARLRYMFWSDVSRKIIAVARLDGTGMTVLVNSSINVPDGLAWDWVNRKLYWTDAVDKDIEVIDLVTTHRKLLVSTGNTTIPRAIVVDPRNRQMYWTDWGTPGKIERASMDGTSRVVLHSTNLRWPNALTLDYNTQTLYWMDAFLDKLESSNADGSNRRLLSRTQIRHPFDVTFYQKRLYWTDWQLNTVYSALVDHPTQVSVVMRGLVLDPMGISVVSVDRQPTAFNPCARYNGGCSHLCLLSNTSAGHTCACPDGHGYRLAANQRDCIVPCRNGDIRLMGGTTVYEGRVEVCWNETWGTVCDDSWTYFDAVVACRQLGFNTTGAQALSRAPFGRGTGPIHLDNLICTSRENRLVDCVHNGIANHNCLHSEDAGLRCPCRNGDIRLVGGTTAFEGRVEICWNRIWGTVCHDSWSPFDAAVACRQLGFPTTGAKVYYGAHFGRGTGPIHLDNLICNSTETKLVDCRHNGIGSHNCIHSEDAGLRCQMPCTNGDIRLRGGTNHYEGRVEICNNNAWGTVCDDSWSTSDANVACKQLGFAPTGAIARSRAYFGRGTGAILLDQLRCTGNETRLMNCPSNPLGIHDCSHYEDAGVTCQAPCTNGDIRLRGGTNRYEGRVEICNNSAWGTVCDDSWSTFDARVACRQLGFSSIGAIARHRAYFGQGTGSILLDQVACTGTETRLVNCRSNPLGIHDCSHSEDAGVTCQALCTNGDIRLAGGTNRYEGRVEICNNNAWGTVCDDFWSTFDARVTCRQLGFSSIGAIARHRAYFGRGTGAILLDQLRCTGNETRLVNCRSNPLGIHDCSHSEDAGVTCAPPCTNGAIRLRGGTNRYEGRVEICNNNAWGTVCDDSWSTFDARVACRQLGFSSIGAIARSRAFFGRGTGPILLDQVACTGTETRLVNCRSNPLGVHDCSHSEDAGVTCAPPCTNGAIRLRGGTNFYEGRVEICNNNAWGTVCDDSWSTSDARVVCRQLGFSSIGAIARSRAYFGRGTGAILLDQVACIGTETRLVNCRSNPLGVHDCSHSEDAGVTCQAPCANGAIRLRGGSNRYEGRVEICNNNAWGTVCDDSWSSSDARVVCRQLGFSTIGAIARSRAYFGQGTGSILLDQVACTGTETRLVNCRSNPLGIHDCSHSEDAGVTCRPLFG